MQEESTFEEVNNISPLHEVEEAEDPLDAMMEGFQGQEKKGYDTNPKINLFGSQEQEAAVYAEDHPS